MCDFLQVVNRHRSSKLLSFWENRLLYVGVKIQKWRISAILDFRGPIMGYLKSPCTTFYDFLQRIRGFTAFYLLTYYRSSIDTMALNCVVFEKIAFFAFWRQTDKQTNKQMDSSDVLSRSRCCERRLNKPVLSAAELTPIANKTSYNILWQRSVTGGDRTVLPGTPVMAEH